MRFDSNLTGGSSTGIPGLGEKKEPSIAEETALLDLVRRNSSPSRLRFCRCFLHLPSEELRFSRPFHRENQSTATTVRPSKPSAITFPHQKSLTRTRTSKQHNDESSTKPNWLKPSTRSWASICISADHSFVSLVATNYQPASKSDNIRDERRTSVGGGSTTENKSLSIILLSHRDCFKLGSAAETELYQFHLY